MTTELKIRLILNLSLKRWNLICVGRYKLKPKSKTKFCEIGTLYEAVGYISLFVTKSLEVFFFFKSALVYAKSIIWFSKQTKTLSIHKAHFDDVLHCYFYCELKSLFIFRLIIQSKLYCGNSMEFVILTQCLLLLSILIPFGNYGGEEFTFMTQWIIRARLKG